MQGEYFRNILGPDKPEPDLIREWKESRALFPLHLKCQIHEP